MSQIQSSTLNQQIGTEPTYFSPAQHFIGIAKEVIASHDDARVSLGGKGSVVMFPERREYYSDVADMAEFCQAPAADFETTWLKKETLPDGMGHAKNIRDLLWQAAFHASQGRLIESSSHGESVHIYDVIRFTRWPNLTRLPTTPNTMRICALLTRHPSSIMLVPRKLGIEPAEMYQVYSAACSSGIVNVISNHLGQADTQADIVDENESSEHVQEHGLLHSLFAKISRL